MTGYQIQYHQIVQDEWPTTPNSISELPADLSPLTALRNLIKRRRGHGLNLVRIENGIEFDRQPAGCAAYPELEGLRVRVLFVASPTALDPFRTTRRPHFRTGRREIWEATTADGVWAFERQEDEGTTWDARHLPTGRAFTHFSTLRRAREQAPAELAAFAAAAAS